VVYLLSYDFENLVVPGQEQAQWRDGGVTVHALGERQSVTPSSTTTTSAILVGVGGKAMTPGAEAKAEKTLSLEGAAQWRKVSLNAIVAILPAGKLPGAKKAGGRWLIPLSELKSYYRSVDERRNRVAPGK
jgi:hypothetical protein